MPETPRDHTTFLAVVHEMMISSQMLREQLMALTITPDNFDPEELALVFNTVNAQLKVQEVLITKLVEENQELLDGIERINSKITRSSL